MYREHGPGVGSLHVRKQTCTDRDKEDKTQALGNKQAEDDQRPSAVTMSRQNRSLSSVITPYITLVICPQLEE